MRPIHLLWLILPAIEVLYAADEVELADGGSAAVRISAQDLTRIAMTGGGRVAKVIGLNSEVSVEPDDEAGQVFIRPAADRSEPFTLHVRDDGGATYTLRVQPVEDLAGGTVFIRAEQGRRRSMHPASPQEPHIVHIKHWLRMLGRGEVPEGVELEHLQQATASRPGLELQLTGRAQGAAWRAEIYALHNVSDVELHLEETQFRGLAKRTRAIALMSRRLAPGERTRLFVLQNDE